MRVRLKFEGREDGKQPPAVDMMLFIPHVVATKALACKSAKAAWYLMAEESITTPHGCLVNRQQRNEPLRFWSAAVSQAACWCKALRTA
jgi:hypothetical protein